MTTKREQILGRIITALAGTALVGSRIYRSRNEPFARSEFPAIVVEPTADAAALNSLQSLVWTLGVRVTVLVRGNVPDAVADPIVEDIHAKLMNDATLNSYLVDIMPASVGYDMTEGDQPIGVISLDYNVSYYTAKSSISG